MKKIILVLLLALSSQVFAQKNELAFSPGFALYHGYYAKAKKAGYKSGLDGNGYQLSLHYLRNIKWLQLGGGIECGKHSPATIESYGFFETHALAKRYIACTILVNARIPFRKWTFTAGPSAGYTLGDAESNWGNTLRYAGSVNRGGFYKGGQLGASYNVKPKLAISAHATARFINFTVEESHWQTAPIELATYDRLNVYQFSLGIQYKF